MYKPIRRADPPDPLLRSLLRSSCAPRCLGACSRISDRVVAPTVTGTSSTTVRADREWEHTPAMQRQREADLTGKVAIITGASRLAALGVPLEVDAPSG
jgi:hypothetical protein